MLDRFPPCILRAFSAAWRRFNVANGTLDPERALAALLETPGLIARDLVGRLGGELPPPQETDLRPTDALQVHLAPATLEAFAPLAEVHGTWVHSGWIAWALLQDHPNPPVAEWALRDACQRQDERHAQRLERPQQTTRPETFDPLEPRRASNLDLLVAVGFDLRLSEEGWLGLAEELGRRGRAFEHPRYASAATALWPERYAALGPFETTEEGLQLDLWDEDELLWLIAVSPREVPRTHATRELERRETTRTSLYEAASTPALLQEVEVYPLRWSPEEERELRAELARRGVEDPAQACRESVSDAEVLRAVYLDWGNDELRAYGERELGPRGLRKPRDGWEPAFADWDNLTLCRWRELERGGLPERCREAIDAEWERRGNPSPSVEGDLEGAFAGVSDDLLYHASRGRAGWGDAWTAAAEAECARRGVQLAALVRTWSAATLTACVGPWWSSFDEAEQALVDEEVRRRRVWLGHVGIDHGLLEGYSDGEVVALARERSRASGALGYWEALRRKLDDTPTSFVWPVTDAWRSAGLLLRRPGAWVWGGLAGALGVGAVWVGAWGHGGFVGAWEASVWRPALLLGVWWVVTCISLVWARVGVCVARGVSLRGVLWRLPLRRGLALGGVIAALKGLVTTLVGEGDMSGFEEGAFTWGLSVGALCVLADRGQAPLRSLGIVVREGALRLETLPLMVGGVMAFGVGLAGCGAVAAQTGQWAVCAVVAGLLGSWAATTWFHVHDRLFGPVLAVGPSAPSTPFVTRLAEWAAIVLLLPTVLGGGTRVAPPLLAHLTSLGVEEGQLYAAQTLGWIVALGWLCLGERWQRDVTWDRDHDQLWLGGSSVWRGEELEWGNVLEGERVHDGVALRRSLRPWTRWWGPILPREAAPPEDVLTALRARGRPTR